MQRNMVSWERIDAGILNRSSGEFTSTLESSIEAKGATDLQKLFERRAESERIVADIGKALMLNVNVQRLGDVTILRCQGRIVAGDEGTVLRNAALSHTDGSILVLDLAELVGMDAGGLGVLLGLHARAHSSGIQVKLMNVPNSVQQMLEVTNLDRVFEICSEKDLKSHLKRVQSGAVAQPVT
jgi:anti-anti-sigma factor